MNECHDFSHLTFFLHYSEDVAIFPKITHIFYLSYFAVNVSRDSSKIKSITNNECFCEQNYHSCHSKLSPKSLSIVTLTTFLPVFGHV